MSDYIAATTHVDTNTSSLVFDSEGYYVVGDDKWQDITFTATMVYQGGNIGIAPRIYDTNMYMFLSIRNEDTDDSATEAVAFADLSAQVTYDTYNIGQVKLAPLVIGTEYTFLVEIVGTNYKISLNGLVIFNIPYPGMSKGKVGVYATAGNTCKSIQVDSLFADGWSSNVTSIPGAIASIRELEDENKYLYLSNASTASLYAMQIRSVTGNKNHTLSFAYNGLGKARVTEQNGAAPKSTTYVLPLVNEWTKVNFTELVSADCTSVNILFIVNAETLMVNDVQLEDKSFATGYIHNESLTSPKVREKSIITYPSKENIEAKAGSLVMWFNPSITYSGTSTFKPVLFEYGTDSPLRLEYEFGNLIFRYGAASVSSPVTLQENTWNSVVLTWSSSLIKMYINGVLTEQEGNYIAPDHSLLLHIGHSQTSTKDLFYGAIDETIILSVILEDDDVELLATTMEPIENSDAMLMRATFNYALGNFNKSIIEATLTPDYGSPVLVEKASGAPMRKVSFFDFYTGEYRTFNEEMIQYDKTYDYIPLSYQDSEVDQDSFKIHVEDVDGVTYGLPYELRGHKLYLYLTEEEKNILDGQYLYATYQLDDSYTVDFNIGVPDSFRVTLGKHDGQAVKVVYEGNGFTDEKLITQVELNPLLSPNHEGFLYITRNDEKVTSFRVRATPDDLPANGGTEALVIVEPLDMYGNYISHCKLDVSCERGTIVPTYDEQSVKLRDRAGRFLYRYRSPIIRMDDIGALEVQDSINIIDRETGIGTQIHITLTTLVEYNHTIAKADTIESIGEKYGSTIEDISYTSDMLDKVRTKYGSAIAKAADTADEVVANARRYVSESIGQTIEVPVNYSSRQLARSTTEIAHDKMIAYLANMISDYMNQPASALPSGLGELLDFNGDGKIDIQEMIWLKNNRLTTVLQTKHTAVLTWDNAN